MTQNDIPQEDNIDHDALFKELLHQCFELFIILFFPQHAAQLDFSDVTFLQQEVFTDFPKGKHRFIDTLAEMRTLRGEPILVHVEFQSSRKPNFPLRMFRYFSQLWLRRNTPIWPIVLYMPRAPEGLGFETYTETLFDEAFLPFRYWCVSLAQLSAEEYLATGNPVAYGLAPLMNHGNLSKPRLKAICLSGIAQSEITEVQAAILACFVDTYLPLTQAEEAEFQQLIQREEVTVMQFITSWERRARFEEARENLLALLGEKFGSLPETVTQQVQSINSKEELNSLLRQLIHANSLVEMGLDGAKK